MAKDGETAGAKNGVVEANGEGWKPATTTCAVIAPRRSPVRVRLAPSLKGLQTPALRFPQRVRKWPKSARGQALVKWRDWPVLPVVAPGQERRTAIATTPHVRLVTRRLDVRVLPRPLPPQASNPETRESYVATMLPPVWLPPQDLEKARSVTAAHFDELCVRGPNGFVWRDLTAVRQVLITWEQAV